ncbi:MAG: Tryptophan synthase alpha chain, partial [Myxococcales bacterium]|nr:Tryptophan synthase alpha chain [Myxococcales bacterium]
TGTAGSTGAAGTTGADGGAVISFATDVWTPIIMNKCKPCHTTNSDAGLSMKDAATGYKSLVGTTMGVAAMNDLMCTMLSAAKKRVVPGDPDHSYLWIKVNGTDASLAGPKCGIAMPKAGSNLTLTAAEKTTIHDWIMSGAKP